MFNTPILFICFNKISESRRVFEAIRSMRPSQLYIAQDGPRTNKAGEAELCHNTRLAIMQSIDWSCQVHTLFREENLGCKNAVHSALSWFFEHVEMGIVLEDDCLPNTEFFFFCEDLLQRYVNDPRIGVISGNSFLPTPSTNDSYYFFTIPQIWGWASWRRAWRLYDPQIKLWPTLRISGLLENIFSDSRDISYWTQIFNQVYHGHIDTWDYQWTFANFANKLLAINPRSNLVTNIGLGSPQATHTSDNASSRFCIPHQEMNFPLQHPTDVRVDSQSADYLYSFCFRG